MHIHTSGDSLSSDMRWQREYKRQIDITQLSQQVETYDIEVDWHALGRIALDCGITIKEGDIVPLPSPGCRKVLPAGGFFSVLHPTNR